MSSSDISRTLDMVLITA
jgi:hypothetical protein